MYWGKSTAVGHGSTVLHDKLKDNKVRVIRKTKDLKKFQSFYDSKNIPQSLNLPDPPLKMENF